MVSESINTAIIVTAGVILAAMVSAALLSQFGVMDSAMRLTVKNAQDRLQTEITIVLASINTSTTRYFVIYAKNVGARSISLQELMQTDVYLKDSYKTVLLTYNSGGGPGKWNFTETVPDGVWGVGETIVIKAFNTTSFSIPTTIIIALPNGVSAEYQYTG
ncbi:MAG: hypothetical protein QW348_00355 [Ignisphaera sp.]